MGYKWAIPCLHTRLVALEHSYHMGMEKDITDGSSLAQETRGPPPSGNQALRFHRSSLWLHEHALQTHGTATLCWACNWLKPKDEVHPNYIIVRLPLAPNTFLFCTWSLKAEWSFISISDKCCLATLLQCSTLSTSQETWILTCRLFSHF